MQANEKAARSDSLVKPFPTWRYGSPYRQTWAVLRVTIGVMLVSVGINLCVAGNAHGGWLIALGVATLVAARLLFVRAVRKALPTERQVAATH
jgi:hypothetical protein